MPAYKKQRTLYGGFNYSSLINRDWKPTGDIMGMKNPNYKDEPIDYMKMMREHPSSHGYQGWGRSRRTMYGGGIFDWIKKGWDIGKKIYDIAKPAIDVISPIVKEVIPIIKPHIPKIRALLDGTHKQEQGRVALNNAISLVNDQKKKAEQVVERKIVGVTRQEAKLQLLDPNASIISAQSVPTVGSGMRALIMKKNKKYVRRQLRGGGFKRI